MKVHRYSNKIKLVCSIDGVSGGPLQPTDYVYITFAFQMRLKRHQNSLVSTCHSVA